MREGVNNLPATVVGGVFGALSGTMHAVVKVVRNPVSAVGGVVDYALSGARVMAPVTGHSPVLRRRSLTSRSEAIDIPFADLHKAAKAAGGSINDAYLAGLCGALRIYHETMGVPIETLPMAVPVSLRSEGDPAGGNRFAGVTLAAPVGVADPARRMQEIRAQMTRKREERAIGVIGAIAPALSVLPTPVLESIVGSIVSSDVQASNVPTYAGESYIAGAKVLRHYGLGPLPGVAMMVVLVSRAGNCTVTARYDRAAVTDSELFAHCLKAGFDEVLALGGEGRSIPASFTATSESPEPNGRVG
jgi:diacylglycerol O-acyltransferase